MTKKRWGRRSPKLGFKGKKDGGLGGGSGGGHPLLSKIQRIASPVTSGETTPTSSLSPMKKSSSMQRHSKGGMGRGERLGEGRKKEKMKETELNEVLSIGLGIPQYL